MAGIVDAAEATPDGRPANLASGGQILHGTASRIAVIGLFIIALLTLLYFGRYILIPITAGLLVGIMLSPIERRLSRLGVGGYAGSGLIVLTIIGAVAGGVASLAIPLESWSSRVPEITDRLVAEWDEISRPIEKLKEVEEKVDEAASQKDGPVEVVVKPRGVVTNMISSAPDMAAWVLLFLGTLFFFLATRSRMRAQALRNCATFKARLSVARLFRDVGRHLSRYIATTATVNAAFGAVVGLAMSILGLPSPHLWGALAMVLNFAQFVGPAIMATILLGVGLVTFDTLSAALAAPLVFIALNVLEGQFVTPAILGRTLTLNPLAVFIMIAIWLWLWGPVGAFLAVPILIVLSVSIGHLLRHEGYPVNVPGSPTAGSA